ncbi:MAG: DNA replication and repair protein RecF [Epsilonproteobacteria bacterium]|nr:DNA replication and repair protein RecF [Campylobacterota bacterium]
MFVNTLTLKNFRCFTEKTFEFDRKCVVIEGLNGSGKTSILEALHYCCYLRSFRTHVQRELINLNNDYFFVTINAQADNGLETNAIKIGYNQREGKVVKLNDKAATSYKDLITHYRLITLTAGDLQLIHGAPELRRDFLSYALLLQDPSLLPVFKRYRQIMQQRNKMLADAHRTRAAVKYSDQIEVWSQKLWEESFAICDQRTHYLEQLGQVINQLLEQYFTNDNTGLSASLTYKHKQAYGQNFTSFWPAYRDKQLHRELALERSLFGAHLDDFLVTFQDKNARTYGSRGQQKLLTLLLKIAQLKLLCDQGLSSILLLDDFMTDFDQNYLARCLQLLYDLPGQFFVTVPAITTPVQQLLASKDCQFIKID